MTARGDAQGAVIFGTGAPPATLIGPVGLIYCDISNGMAQYVMSPAGTWTAPSIAAASTGTGALVRETTPTIATPVLTNPTVTTGTFTSPTLSLPIIGVVAVGALPAAAAGNKGARATVSDSNATTTAGIGAVVAAGGANCNPVYSDGAAWRIG